MGTYGVMRWTPPGQAAIVVPVEADSLEEARARLWGAEDVAWKDAYGIAFIGAVNPLAVAGTLARDSSALMDVLRSTKAVCEHPALRAIAEHLAFLYSAGLGATVEHLDWIEYHARRLGIFVPGAGADMHNAGR